MLVSTELSKPIVSSLEPFMADLESRIDPAVETCLRQEWVAFLEGRFTGGIFSPHRPAPSPSRIVWPEVRVNQTLENPDNMALQQLRAVSETLAQGNGNILNVRANYSTAILPSLFNPQLFIMDDNYNTLPTNYPLEGGCETFKKLIAGGVPALDVSLAGKTLAMGRYFNALFRDYPKLRQFVSIYHPDLQSPMDVAELLWGSGIFTDLIDVPDLVLDFLHLLTECYIRYMNAWADIVPFHPHYNSHWGFLLKGKIMLRDDSAMNMSPEMYQQFIMPFDAHLLREFGGGAFHYCGRGDHFVPFASTMPELTAIHLSQPGYNDMEQIFRHTVDKGINILALSGKTIEWAFAGGRLLHGRVHNDQAYREKTSA